MNGTARHVLDVGGVAHRQAVGGFHDRGDRRGRRGVAFEGGLELWQRVHGMTDQRLHAIVRGDRAVEHAVEHVLDLPGELAQQAGTDKTAGTLQGVERTADRHHRVAAFRIGQPVAKSRTQVGDFFLGFLEEDLADLVVDTVDGDLEAGELGHAVAAHFLLDLFLDLDPVLFAGSGRRRFPGDGLDGHGGKFVVGRRLVDEIEAVGEAGDGFARVDAGRRHGDMFDRGGLDLLEGRLAECLVLVLVPGRDRPVTEFSQAVLGDVEDMFQATAVFAGGFEVVLECGERIRQAVHLHAIGHAAVAEQLAMDEQADAIGEFGRTGRTEHAHGAADLGHQFRRTGQLVVVPRRFDEADDRVLHLGGVGRGFAHQRGKDMTRFAARKRRRAEVARGRGLVALRAEAFDMVVQRGFDVEQRAGDVQQRLLVRLARARGDFTEDAALFAHHAARYAQGEHAQGVAHAVEHFRLQSELRGIAIGPAQEQVERFLHAKQVVLDRRRHGVEQRTVVARHRTTGMLEFRRLRQQAFQAVGLAQFFDAFAARLGLGDVIQELARQFVGIAVVQRFLATVDQFADGTVDAADQLANVLFVGAQHAALEAFEHAGGDPPQATARDGVATRGEAVQRRRACRATGVRCPVRGTRRAAAAGNARAARPVRRG